MRILSFLIGLFISISVIVKIGLSSTGIMGGVILFLVSIGITGSLIAITGKPRTSMVFFILASVPLIVIGAYTHSENISFSGIAFILPLIFERIEIERWKWLKREERKPLIETMEENAMTEVEELEGMNGVQFEDKVAHILGEYGFQIERTPVTGDKGIDIAFYAEGEKICLQLKHWKDKVGDPVVRDAYGSKALNQCDRFFILTTHGFTSRAIESAKNLNIHLITYDDLLEQLKKWYQQNPFLKEE